MTKSAKSQTLKIIGDQVSLTLSTSDLNKNLISVDFCDEPFKEYFEMDLNRETLKGMAEFILKYLKNN